MCRPQNIPQQSQRTLQNIPQQPKKNIPEHPKEHSRTFPNIPENIPDKFKFSCLWSQTTLWPLHWRSKGLRKLGKNLYTLPIRLTKKTWLKRPRCRNVWWDLRSPGWILITFWKVSFPVCLVKQHCRFSVPQSDRITRTACKPEETNRRNGFRLNGMNPISIQSQSIKLDHNTP